MKQGLLAVLLVAALAACGEKPAETPKALSKPALSVDTIRPQAQSWPQTLSASGNVAAWQEAVIGAELGGYRITEVLANVGDRVRRGQVLARIASDTVDQEVAESRASVAEAEANLAEARANVERARALRDKGFYSAQQNTREQTSADTALARLNAAKARLQSAELRRSKAVVIAPDDGIISARLATVGSMTETGKELFRLIRNGRLEWRAELAVNDLHRVKIGQIARLTAPNGLAIDGRVRIVAPTADPNTRLALVYVDLPTQAGTTLGAGMFVRGEFELDQQPALTLPSTAVLLRDGFAYAFRVEPTEGGMARVTQTKVQTGRQRGEMIEVIGLPPDTPVVATGAGFLADGDTVRLTSTPAPTPSPAGQ